MATWNNPNLWIAATAAAKILLLLVAYRKRLHTVFPVWFGSMALTALRSIVIMLGPANGTLNYIYLWSLTEPISLIAAIASSLEACSLIYWRYHPSGVSRKAVVAFGILVVSVTVGPVPLSDWYRVSMLIFAANIRRVVSSLGVFMILATYMLRRWHGFTAPSSLFMHACCMTVWVAAQGLHHLLVDLQIVSMTSADRLAAGAAIVSVLCWIAFVRPNVDDLRTASGRREFDRGGRLPDPPSGFRTQLGGRLLTSNGRSGWGLESGKALPPNPRSLS